MVVGVGEEVDEVLKYFRVFPSFYFPFLYVCLTVPRRRRAIVVRGVVPVPISVSVSIVVVPIV